LEPRGHSVQLREPTCATLSHSYVVRSYYHLDKASYTFVYRQEAEVVNMLADLHRQNAPLSTSDVNRYLR